MESGGSHYYYTTGRVIGYTGPSPGPADGIAYKVRVNTRGSGVVEFDGVKPAGWRWTDVDVDAAELVGKDVPIVVVANEVHGLFVEPPHLVECGTG